MDVQVENAVQISLEPQSSGELRVQAAKFLQEVKESQDGWQACLPLFTRKPRSSEPVRVYAIDVLNSAIQQKYHPLDDQSLLFIRDAIMAYVREEFLPEVLAETKTIQNKVAQLLTYLFTRFYTSTWISFFDEFLALTSTGIDAATRQIKLDSRPGVLLWLRLLTNIHDEVADQLINRSQTDAQRNMKLKDEIRDQDAKKLVQSWQDILQQWRASSEIVELCLKVVGRWVSWIDISLIVNENLLNLIFQFLAGDESQELGSRTREVAVDTLSDLVSKKMQTPAKLELFAYLNVDQIVVRLCQLPEMQPATAGSNYDVDFAEGVAKLVAALGRDVVIMLDDSDIALPNKERAEQYLQMLAPFMLRFLADDYDEVSISVYTFCSNLLAFFRKETRQNILPQSHLEILAPILRAVVLKMKYDETADWGAENEETEEAEFVDLRKKLKLLQDQIAMISDSLYIETLSAVIGTTFERLQAGNQVDWREVDLAMYQMYNFGEMAMKNGAMLVKGEPNGPAAMTLVEMVKKMVACGLPSYNHPAIELQFGEVIVRYASVFDANPDLIPTALDALLRNVHSEHPRVSNRSYYLLFRFIKLTRNKQGPFAQRISAALSDVLMIRAEVPSEELDDEDMSDDTRDSNAFNSQLYLFETIGCLASLASNSTEEQIYYIKSVTDPIFSDMEAHYSQAKEGDLRASYQIHHDIMALGTLGKGFSDWSPGQSAPQVQPSQAPDLEVEFKRTMEAILISLETLNDFVHIREAVRFAFARMVGVLGERVLPLLPRYLESLFVKSSTKEEMSVFLRLLDQLAHQFKSNIFDMLNQILTPLLERVLVILDSPAEGTDDEIHLTELRREQLTFIVALLNEGLSGVFVSDMNRPFFDKMISTLDFFAKDSTDTQTQRFAFTTMTRMCEVWGGVLPLPQGKASRQSSASSSSTGQLQMNGSTIPPHGKASTALAGFDVFMIQHFNPTCWAVPAAPNFNAKDAQSRVVVAEIAGLQKAIYLQTGDEFIKHLRQEWFPRMGVEEAVYAEYLNHLQNLDPRSFKRFFQSFIQNNT